VSAPGQFENRGELSDAEIDAILAEKERDRRRAYYQANRAKIIERATERYWDNRDEICAKWRDRYATDPAFREREKQKWRERRKQGRP
jgi:hypothetical protein